MNRIDIYSGANSPYEQIKTFAQIKFPPNHKWEFTSDETASKLLSCTSGIPTGNGYVLRDMLRVIAYKELGYYLLGISNNAQEVVKKIKTLDVQIYYVMNRLALPAH